MRNYDVCEKILANKVVADQIFTCANTESLGEIPVGDTLDDITFTLENADCQLTIDTANDQVSLGMTFTLDVDVALIPDTDNFPFSCPNTKNAVLISM